MFSDVFSSIYYIYLSVYFCLFLTCSAMSLCVFLCQCVSSSVTYLSVIWNSCVRSRLRGQSWARIGFIDMCLEVRGYRDEMTLIGQSESDVCSKTRLGCEVKGESLRIIMGRLKCSHACVGCHLQTFLQFDFTVVWSDMPVSPTYMPLSPIYKEYKYILFPSVRLTGNVLLIRWILERRFFAFASWFTDIFIS